MRAYNAASLRRGIDSVEYTGEDAGGVGLRNEFYSVLAASVVGESRTALFETRPDSVYEQIRAEALNLERFSTLGKFFALCVISGIPSGIPLPTVFFRRLLDQRVSVDDVRVLDEVWAKSAEYLLKVTTQEELDVVVAGGPLPGSGSVEPFTLENCQDQIQLVIDNIVMNNSPEQFRAIAEGFFFVLPRELFGGISGDFLKDMIVGTLNVDTEGLIANIKFHTNVPVDHQTWLRNIVGGFDDIQRRQFLRFVTGFPVLPSAGWAAVGPLLVSAIRRTQADGRVVEPRSQTCFKKLYLPLYIDEEEMRITFHNVLTHAVDVDMHEH